MPRIYIHSRRAGKTARHELLKELQEEVMREGPGYMPSSTPEELCEFLFGELPGANMNQDTPTNRYHDYLEQLKKNEGRLAPASKEGKTAIVVGGCSKRL